jgi:predicted secreted protein
MRQGTISRPWFHRLAVIAVLAGTIAGTTIAGTTLAHAQSGTLLPEGQTLITLTVTERTNVAQDLLMANLRIEIENRDQNAVQSGINAAMEQALSRVRAVAGVDVSSGHYGVYQINRQTTAGRPDLVWRGSQGINLQGKDSAALLSLAGELQAMGFLMNQLSYHLSTEQADQVRDSLMEAAIVRAREKAERATRALGKTTFDIASLDVDSSSNFAPPMMMRSMAADSMEMAAPVAEAGETEVTLTIRIQAVAR